MKTIRNLLIIAVVSCCLVGCGQREVYSSYHTIASKGWRADSMLHFEFEITDTSAIYQMLIQVRHNEQYPYQNMWLIVEDSARHACPLDTIEFYLADNRGRWLGNNHTGYIEMPVLYEAQRKFTSGGRYGIRIQQAMRNEFLPGVMDVGLVIKKNG